MRELNELELDAVVGAGPYGDISNILWIDAGLAGALAAVPGPSSFPIGVTAGVFGIAAATFGYFDSQMT